MRIKCPTCDGKGHIFGIDERYPLDGNVALRCETCRWSGTVLSDDPPTPVDGDNGPDGAVDRG